MTSSLVGSEMCIRDSNHAVRVAHDRMLALHAALWLSVAELENWARLMAVSYTHLTLPTICSV
eukprot:7125018-Prorocentrum_lima.AAC.1